MYLSTHGSPTCRQSISQKYQFSLHCGKRNMKRNSIYACSKSAENDEMNVTGFGDDDNDTFVGKENRSNNTMSEELRLDWTTALVVRHIILYVVWALGIPGNILSAIVWLRRHVASENPSAIYLAALNIDDLGYLLFTVLCRLGCSPIGCNTCVDTWFCCFLSSSAWSTTFLEPLLVLSFSVVRLIAIRRPLQVHVCRITRFILINRKLCCCRKIAWRPVYLQFTLTRKIIAAWNYFHSKVLCDIFCSHVRQ